MRLKPPTCNMWWLETGESVREYQFWFSGIQLLFCPDLHSWPSQSFMADTLWVTKNICHCPTCWYCCPTGPLLLSRLNISISTIINAGEQPHHITTKQELDYSFDVSPTFCNVYISATVAVAVLVVGRSISTHPHSMVNCQCFMVM